MKTIKNSYIDFMALFNLIYFYFKALNNFFENAEVQFICHVHVEDPGLR